MLVLLHGGVRVHMLRGGCGELRGHVHGDVRGRGEVILCGGVRRREHGGRGRVLELLRGGGRVDVLGGMVRPGGVLADMRGRYGGRRGGVRRRQRLVVRRVQRVMHGGVRMGMHGRVLMHRGMRGRDAQGGRRSATTGTREAGDGCSSACVVESGYTCGGALEYGECGGAGDTCESGCGEGVMEAGTVKECDDGNTEGGDGCSRTCRIECGWACGGGDAQGPDGCFAAACGDSTLGGMEECDDGNVVDGDGCSSSCRVEDGILVRRTMRYRHSRAGHMADRCEPVCGDGLVVGS